MGANEAPTLVGVMLLLIEKAMIGIEIASLNHWLVTFRY